MPPSAMLKHLDFKKHFCMCTLLHFICVVICLIIFRKKEGHQEEKPSKGKQQHRFIKVVH